MFARSRKHWFMIEYFTALHSWIMSSLSVLRVMSLKALTPTSNMPFVTIGHTITPSNQTSVAFVSVSFRQLITREFMPFLPAIECPEAPWFQNNTVAGTWDYDTELSLRSYGHNIEYTCPEGLVIHDMAASVHHRFFCLFSALFLPFPTSPTTLAKTLA